MCDRSKSLFTFCFSLLMFSYLTSPGFLGRVVIPMQISIADISGPQYLFTILFDLASLLGYFGAKGENKCERMVLLDVAESVTRCDYVIVPFFRMLFYFIFQDSSSKYLFVFFLFLKCLTTLHVTITFLILFLRVIFFTENLSRGERNADRAILWKTSKKISGLCKASPAGALNFTVFDSPFKRALRERAIPDNNLPEKSEDVWKFRILLAQLVSLWLANLIKLTRAGLDRIDSGNGSG